MPIAVSLAEEKMRAAGLDEAAIATFLRLQHQLLDGDRGLLASGDLEPVVALPELAGISGERAPLDALAIIKVNGGLGTSMGLRGPKSLVEVRPGLTFLDAIAEQVRLLRRRHRARLPLVLMSSFATREATRAALAAHGDLSGDLPCDFEQGIGPKLARDDLRPVAWPANPSLEWCPSGHGEVYAALRRSGLLSTLLDSGYRYAFISNVDNLGAVADPRVLAWMVQQEAPFVMEVVDGTPADRKGGHIARRDGRLLLRETAQTPPEDAASFGDFRRWRFYNTNNLWVDLKALDEVLEGSNGALHLPLIVNEKTVDPTDPSSTPVVQLETAMGAALGLIEGAEAIRVTRDRFAPVKTTDDLLVLWSDAYVFRDGVARPTGPQPLVRLDPRYFSRLEDLRDRFPDGPPSLRDCSRLTVHGDVRFGAGVTVVGDAELRADVPLHVPAGSVLGT